MPEPNTNDLSVIDGAKSAEYIPFGGSSLYTIAIPRPLIDSRARNVERYVQLHAEDHVFHGDTHNFGALVLSPANVDESGEIVTPRDVLWVDGAEHQVLFAEYENMRNSAIVVARQI